MMHDDVMMTDVFLAKELSTTETAARQLRDRESELFARRAELEQQIRAVDSEVRARPDDVIMTHSDVIAVACGSGKVVTGCVHQRGGSAREVPPRKSLSRK